MPAPCFAQWKDGSELGARKTGMISQVSHEQYRSGFFLLKRLGAERHLDPEFAATIGHLRQFLLGEAGEPTAAGTMLTDLAVLSYYHVFRLHDWIGDLATTTVHAHGTGPS